MTKSPHIGTSTEAPACSASVKYKDRQGACRRDAKYPDIDGIRWWCGLHDPNRKAKVIATTAAVSMSPEAGQDAGNRKAVARPAPVEVSRVVKADVLLSASQAQVADAAALEALEAASAAFADISNTNTIGWNPATPVDNYKVIMSHMRDRASEANSKVRKAIRQLKS